MPDPKIKHSEWATCEIEAVLENVSKTARLLKNFCQLRGLDETLWPSIELGFCEGLNNAIEHGRNEEPSKPIHVSWSWIGKKLKIKIEDPNSFKPIEGKANLPEDDLADSGRGSFIIDSVFDDVEHSQTDYGHLLFLEKNIHESQDMLSQVQEMYELLHSLTDELGTNAKKNETINFLTKLIAIETNLETILSRSIKQLSTIANICDFSFWKHSNSNLKSVYRNKKFDEDIKRRPVDPQEESAFKNNETTIFEQEIEGNIEYKIVSPVHFQTVRTGLISITLKDTNRAVIDKELIELIQTFSDCIGIAQNQFSLYQTLEYIERENAQMEIASEIQKSLLPSEFPNNVHCKMTGRCVTAMAVGGDYIDTIEVKDQGVLIIIADVMGKGVPAALLATIFRTAIRSRLNLAETPGWLLAKINKQIHTELGHLNIFITAQAAFYTYEKKILKLASAGHCPALSLNKSDHSVTQLSAEGIPLGIDANDIYEERLYDLNSGDRVLFFTDGLYEAENSKGEMLGIDRLSNCLPSLWTDGLESLPNHAFNLISEFSSENTLQDDQTLMALEIL